MSAKKKQADDRKPLNLQSRNLTTEEVTHRIADLTDDLLPIAYFLQGYAQGFRDAATIYFKKEVRINIESGYRTLEYNKEIYKNIPKTPENERAMLTSNHIWRFEEAGSESFKVAPGAKSFRVAFDVTSPDVPLDQLFEFATKFCRGEVYKNISQGIVHIAPCGPIKRPFQF